MPSWHMCNFCAVHDPKVEIALSLSLQLPDFFIFLAAQIFVKLPNFLRTVSISIFSKVFDQSISLSFITTFYCWVFLFISVPYFSIHQLMISIEFSLATTYFWFGKYFIHLKRIMQL